MKIILSDLNGINAHVCVRREVEWEASIRKFFGTSFRHHSALLLCSSDCYFAVRFKPSSNWSHSPSSNFDVCSIHRNSYSQCCPPNTNFNDDNINFYGSTSISDSRRKSGKDLLIQEELKNAHQQIIEGKEMMKAKCSLVRHISHEVCRKYSLSLLTLSISCFRRFHLIDVLPHQLLNILPWNCQVRTPLNTATIGVEILEEELAALSASGVEVPSQLLEIVRGIKGACTNALEVGYSFWALLVLIDSVPRIVPWS